MTTATLHPTFNAILAGVQAMPVQIARAQYVGRLAAFDWTHEQADDMSVVRRGRAELAELRKLREQLDPDHALWNRHAPEWMHTVTTVHTFKDFTGKAPVTVEWVATIHGPRVIAVVVETPQGPCAIQEALRPEVMDRYQEKANRLGASVRVQA